MQILCATDFSKAAMAAADVAAALSKKIRHPLRLVHCMMDCIVMGDLPVAMPDDKLLREQLKREADRLRAADIEVVEELRQGGVSTGIIAAAAEQPTQMIVLGSVGSGMAERWLIGSVAERVAEGASVPTLVVRQPELLMDWLRVEARLRLICAVDFTASAGAALRWLKTLTGLGCVEVEASHVRTVDDPFHSAEQQAACQRMVSERLHDILGEVPVKVHVGNAIGSPAVEFLHTADEQRSGLLVVGTHQRHGWQRLKAPSFSRDILAHATTNVLCVPATAVTSDTHIPAIRCVLLAMNFTPVCTQALRHAHSLLPSGGTIHLVHVCHEPERGINPVIASEVYFDHSLATAQEKREAEEKMKALPASLLAVPGVTITSEILTHYDPAAAICDAAVRAGADVICMGTKGHSRTGVALLGSTVQAVLARAHIPVFAVTSPLL